jgi:3,4-dihydroxy 2-butanone 4-phosphate synthase
MGKQGLEASIRAFREGRAVVLMDDPDRENEGDIIIPADRITTSLMALMIRECSGIVCLCIDQELALQLELPPMATHNTNHHGTAFTVSIEARDGISTGVSAYDRVVTINAALKPGARPEDLARPGHVFPLVAHPQGLRGRRGHTEGAVTLARLAGYRPAAVLCELMQPDGTMMRGQELARFAAMHDFPLLTIRDLVDELKLGPLLTLPRGRLA